MPIKKAKPKKKSVKKKSVARKRAGKKPVARTSKEPKTAAELGITCAALVDGEKCGKPVLWFDYQLGEKSHMMGFVCDEHRVSNRVEKLAIKQTASATA